MNGFEVCKTLLALKLHFTSKSYDYHKYGGSVSLTPDGYNIRKDKYWCEKLARKHSDKEKFVDFASTVYAYADYPKKLWTTDFANNASQYAYDISIAYTDAIEYRFKQELETIMQKGIDTENNINWAISETDYAAPPIVNMLFRKEVSLEFACLLDFRYEMIHALNSKFGDDMFYEQYATRVSRFRPFLIARLGIDYESIGSWINVTVKKVK